MIEKNIHLNKDLIVGHTTVMPLDFGEPELSDALWKKLRDVNIIIAADGSYDSNFIHLRIKYVKILVQNIVKNVIFVKGSWFMILTTFHSRINTTDFGSHSAPGP